MPQGHGPRCWLLIHFNVKTCGN